MLSNLSYWLACQVSDHLLKTGQAFCFIGGYGLISKEHCEKVIDEFNKLK